MPYHVAARNLYLEGFQTKEAKNQEWRRRVITGEWKCKRDPTREGSLLVGEYAGHFEDHVRSEGLVGRVAQRTGDILEASDLTPSWTS